MKPERIANIVRAITQRSVLLSTKTKNAHIQLHNQSNNIIQPVPKVRFSAFSSRLIFSEKYSITSFMRATQNIKHKGHDKKFMLTAIVSGESRHQLNIDQILNQNVMNAYRKNGIVHAVHTFHQSNQKFSAIIFGVYIYA
jgi:hypothetical protein